VILRERFALRLFLSLLFFLALPGCGEWLQDTPSVAINKPLTEHRAFRYLELDNGLKVLLISDPTADKAAASLDVNVGSRQDPENYQGLAHFLEHMLFLGTEKYPEAGEYQAFITAHGGSHNAYTSFEHTNYFFDIAVDSLEPALDRFAQFFVGPLFNAEYVQREVNAVDSEYQARIRNDGRRELAVFKSQLNPDHPFSKFSVGNLDTLHVDDEAALRQALLNFYQRYYSANIMSLTVAGRESLATLEAMVRARFSAVKQHKVDLAPIDTPLFASADIGKPALPHWVNIVPVQNRRSLSVQFPVPDTMPYWQTKPLSYIGNLLGHEGAGSLLSELKRRGWAESLSAGQSLDYNGGALFGVTVALTESGLENVDEIVSLIYADIGLLNKAGVAQWRYDEQAGLARQEFLFRAQPALIHEVVQLSENLHNYPADEVVRGPYQMALYEQALLKRYLDEMRPENSFVTLIAPEAATDQHIPRYQVDYSVRQLPESLLQRWQAALAGSGVATAGLAMPEANAFITQDFSLVKSGTESPVRLPVEQEHTELWLHGDNEYGLPKGRLYLLLESPLVADSPESRAKSALWLQMVKDQLNELAYPASLAGLSFSLDSSWRGVELRISGFSEKQAVMLEAVLKALRAPDWQQGRFDRLKAQLLRAYENRRQQAPYQQVMGELPVVLNVDQPELEAMVSATEGVTMPAVAQHVSKVLKRLGYRILVDGNFDQQAAENVANVVATTLPEPVEGARPERKVVRLERGVVVSPLEISHDDAALAFYLQAPDAGKRWRVAMGLAAQMISSDFYHQLRTQKQLGYIVNAGAYPQRDVGGLLFLVQSPVMDAAGLQGEVLAWLKGWVEQGVSEDDFEKYKDTLLKRLRERPENLWEAADRHWTDLLQGYESFDSREQLAQALEALSYGDFTGMMSSALRESEQRGVFVYTQGRWLDKRMPGREISDIEAFKQALPAYSFQ
jgi:insulysin